MKSNAFIVCAGCGCHVKAFEAVCPFCAAPQRRPATEAARRVSSGAGGWIGVGTACLALSCSSTTTLPDGTGLGSASSTAQSSSGKRGLADARVSEADASHPGDAAHGEDVTAHRDARDAAKRAEDAADRADVRGGDARAADAGAPRDAARIKDAAGIACGDASCKAGSEICVEVDGVESSCRPSPHCDSSEICRCIIPDASPSCQCYGDDSGVVDCISHTCYGSPPPRRRRPAPREITLAA